MLSGNVDDPRTAKAFRIYRVCLFPECEPSLLANVQYLDSGSVPDTEPLLC